MSDLKLPADLPLSYCTNVHPGTTLAEVQNGLETYTCNLQKNVKGNVAAGLWLARSVIDDILKSPDGIPQFADWLSQRELQCYTLNAFPFGDFHSERVKENVYLPDWTTNERRDYTLDCARVLAGIMPDCEGSISTVPLGFAGFQHSADFETRCFEKLCETAHGLHQLHSETGRLIRLAIEPEPLCVLERIDQQVIAFFERLKNYSREHNASHVVDEYIGLCFDVCHQSVEFEDVQDCIRKLAAAEIRINKVHITCAIQLDDPANNDAGRELLAKYVEPRYLHQTFAKLSDGTILNRTDLDVADVTRTPPDRFMQADTWRIHFHVPVNAETLGPLKTTRPDLRLALAEVQKLDYQPHLEVETYTWGVLPGEQPPNLVDGLSAEIEATQKILNTLRGS